MSNVCPHCGESPIFAIPATDRLQGPGRRGHCPACGAKGPWKRLAKDAFRAFSHPKHLTAAPGQVVVSTETAGTLWAEIHDHCSECVAMPLCTDCDLKKAKNELRAAIEAAKKE